jgi:hypothetical protein
MIGRFTAFALLVTLANLLPTFTHAQQLAAAPSDRVAVRRYVLMLEGAAAAYPLSVSGGNGVGEVVSEPPAPDGTIHKHLTNPHYEAFVLELGVADLSPPLRDWIRAMLARRPIARNGSVWALDVNDAQVETRDFTQALITNILFPTADAISKEAPRIVLTFEVERVTRRPGDGTRITAQLTKSKSTSASNFRFRIDGLDAPLQRAIRVDAPEVSQDLTQDSGGPSRIPSVTGGPLQLGNLMFVVPEVNGAALYDWLEDFVVKGNNSSEKERTGTLEFLAPNLKDVILAVGFRGLGIVRVTQSTAASAEQVSRLQVELYCEEMELL